MELQPIIISTSRGDITLPHPSKLPTGAIRRARKTDDPVEQFFALIEGIFPEGSDELALVDSVPVDELTELFTTWLGDVSVGESAGSSN